MKTLSYLLLLTELLLAAPLRTAAADRPDSTQALTKSVEINFFLGAREKVNLILAVRQPRRVTVRLLDANQAVVYTETFRRAVANHWLKFDFEGMKAGVYGFEISDGSQKITRQIEIGHIPAVDSQRYITSLP